MINTDKDSIAELKHKIFRQHLKSFYVTINKQRYKVYRTLNLKGETIYSIDSLQWFTDIFELKKTARLN